MGTSTRGRWLSLLVVLLLLVLVAGNAPIPGLDSGAVESDAEPSGENEAIVEAAIEAAIEATEEVVVDDASGGAESDADLEDEVDVEDIKEQLVDHLKKAMESGKVKVFVKSEIKAKQAAVPLESFNGDKLDDSFERENHFVVGVSSSVGGPDDAECGAHERKIYVTNYEGMRLECIVPVVEREGGNEAEGDNGDGEAAPDAGQADLGDLASAPSHEERVRELAGDLLGEDTLNNCHKKVDGWWTYEICPMAHVRQYHEENLKILSSFELGLIDWEQTREALEDKGRGSKAVTFFYNQVGNHAQSLLILSPFSRPHGSDSSSFFPLCLCLCWLPGHKV